MQYYALSDSLSAVWLWCVFLYSGSCLLLGVLPVLKRLDDHAVKTTVERIPFEERKGYLFTKSYRMVRFPPVHPATSLGSIDAPNFVSLLPTRAHTWSPVLHSGSSEYWRYLAGFF